MSSIAAVIEHHFSGSIVVNSVRSIVTEAAELVSPVIGLGSVSNGSKSAGDPSPRGLIGLRVPGTGSPFWLKMSFKLAFSDFSAASLSLKRSTSFSSSRIYPCVRWRWVLHSPPLGKCSSECPACEPTYRCACRTCSRRRFGDFRAFCARVAAEWAN